MTNYFINEIVKIMNTVQNKRNNFCEVTINEVNTGDSGKYTIISDGTFKVYVVRSRIRFVKNLKTNSIVDFAEWSDSTNQLICFEMFYGA